MATMFTPTKLSHSASAPPEQPRLLGVDRADALLLDAGMKQTLSVTRSLGRAGLAVALAECRSGLQDAPVPPAFWSRWARSTAMLPDYAADADGYAAGVFELVKACPTVMVVPGSDQSVESIRPWRARIERYAKVAMPAEAGLALATDKGETIRLATSLGIATPRTVHVESEDELPAALAELGYPAVVKPTTSWQRAIGGLRMLSTDVLDLDEARQAARALWSRGGRVLLQQWAGGKREAVCLFRANGKVVGEFALAYLRTTPMLGGASVLRESIPMPTDLRGTAVRLVEAMDLDGYSEVEFRRHRDGRALLMEVNPRLSGSLELAVRSGVNFPLMMWNWASGDDLPGPTGYRSGVRLRWLTGEGRWLVETFRRPGRPDSVRPARAVAAVATEFFRRDAYDFVDFRDLRPALGELIRVAKRLRVKASGAAAEQGATPPPRQKSARNDQERA